MKTLIIAASLGLTLSSYAADYKVIGETSECADKALVIEEISTKGSTLLAIEDHAITKLFLYKTEQGVKYYSSSVIEDAPLGQKSYEAILMAPEMSVLSRLKIYLSGVMFDCSLE